MCRDEVFPCSFAEPGNTGGFRRPEQETETDTHTFFCKGALHHSEIPRFLMSIWHREIYPKEACQAILTTD